MLRISSSDNIIQHFSPFTVPFINRSLSNPLDDIPFIVRFKQSKLKASALNHQETLKLGLITKDNFVPIFGCLVLPFFGVNFFIF